MCSKIANNYCNTDVHCGQNNKRKPIFVWSVQRDKGLKETIATWINHVYPTDNKAKLYIFGVEKIPNKGLGKTINDRLKRASIK